MQNLESILTSITLSILKNDVTCSLRFLFKITLTLAIWMVRTRFRYVCQRHGPRIQYLGAYVGKKMNSTNLYHRFLIEIGSDGMHHDQN